MELPRAFASVKAADERIDCGVAAVPGCAVPLVPSPKFLLKDSEIDKSRRFVPRKVDEQSHER